VCVCIYIYIYIFIYTPVIESVGARIDARAHPPTTRARRHTTTPPAHAPVRRTVRPSSVRRARASAGCAHSTSHTFGCRVQGSGCRVQGAGFWVSGFRVLSRGRGGVKTDYFHFSCGVCSPINHLLEKRLTRLVCPDRLRLSRNLSKTWR